MKKELTGIAKTHATMHARVERLRKKLIIQIEANKNLKTGYRLATMFCAKLLQEGRITKKEMKPYFPKRNRIKSI